MRYLLLLSLILIGCESADYYGVKIGDMVTINKGFYKGCTGMITRYKPNDTLPDQINLKDVTCQNVTINFLETDAKNLLK